MSGMSFGPTGSSSESGATSRISAKAMDAAKQLADPKVPARKKWGRGWSLWGRRKSGDPARILRKAIRSDKSKVGKDVIKSLNYHSKSWNRKKLNGKAKEDLYTLAKALTKLPDDSKFQMLKRSAHRFVEDCDKEKWLPAPTSSKESVEPTLLEEDGGVPGDAPDGATGLAEMPLSTSSEQPPLIDRINIDLFGEGVEGTFQENLLSAASDHRNLQDAMNELEVLYEEVVAAYHDDPSNGEVIAVLDTIENAIKLVAEKFPDNFEVAKEACEWLENLDFLESAGAMPILLTDTVLDEPIRGAGTLRSEIDDVAEHAEPVPPEPVVGVASEAASKAFEAVKGLLQKCLDGKHRIVMGKSGLKVVKRGVKRAKGHYSDDAKIAAAKDVLKVFGEEIPRATGMESLKEIQGLLKAPFLVKIIGNHPELEQSAIQLGFDNLKKQWDLLIRSDLNIADMLQLINELNELVVELKAVDDVVFRKSLSDDIETILVEVTVVVSDSLVEKFETIGLSTEEGDNKKKGELLNELVGFKENSSQTLKGGGEMLELIDEYIMFLET